LHDGYLEALAAADGAEQQFGHVLGGLAQLSRNIPIPGETSPFHSTRRTTDRETERETAQKEAVRATEVLRRRVIVADSVVA
jgi:hypothetical protein